MYRGQRRTRVRPRSTSLCLLSQGWAPSSCFCSTIDLAWRWETRGAVLVSIQDLFMHTYLSWSRIATSIPDLRSIIKRWSRFRSSDVWMKIEKQQKSNGLRHAYMLFQTQSWASSDYRMSNSFWLGEVAAYGLGNFPDTAWPLPYTRHMSVYVRTRMGEPAKASRVLGRPCQFRSIQDSNIWVSQADQFVQIAGRGPLISVWVRGKGHSPNGKMTQNGIEDGNGSFRSSHRFQRAVFDSWTYLLYHNRVFLFSKDLKCKLTREYLFSLTHTGQAPELELVEARNPPGAVLSSNATLESRRMVTTANELRISMFTAR